MATLKKVGARKFMADSRLQTSAAFYGPERGTAYRLYTDESREDDKRENRYTFEISAKELQQLVRFAAGVETTDQSLNVVDNRTLPQRLRDWADKLEKEGAK